MKTERTTKQIKRNLNNFTLIVSSSLLVLWILKIVCRLSEFYMYPTYITDIDSPIVKTLLSTLILAKQTIYLFYIIVNIQSKQIIGYHISIILLTFILKYFNSFSFINCFSG